MRVIWACRATVAVGLGLVARIGHANMTTQNAQTRTREASEEDDA